MDVSQTETLSKIEVQHGPETRKECKERLKKRLKQRFDEVNNSGKHEKLYTDHVKQRKAIVDISLLLQLFRTSAKLSLAAVNVKFVDVKQLVVLQPLNGDVLWAILEAGHLQRCFAKRKNKMCSPIM